MLLQELLVVLALILLNGFFSLSELAVVSSRKGRLQQLAAEGHRGAAAAVRLAEDPARFLSAVQVGITLVGILTGAFGGAALAEHLAGVVAGVPALASAAYELSFALIVVLVTYFTLIVGELVPKQVALRDPERVAIVVAPAMLAVTQVARPLVWFLGASSQAVLRLLRIPAQVEPRVTEEEVRTMIEEGTQSGVFEPEEREMLEAVMRLSDRTVRAIMTPRPDIVWLDPDDPPEEIRTTLREGGHSRFPVSRGDLDEVEGVVHAKDLMDQALGEGALDLQRVLVQPLVVHEGTPVFKMLDLFRQAGAHLAIVVDEYGSVTGLVTATDILEGIAGELPEEGQEPEPTAQRREDGSWLVDGMMPVEDLEEILGIPLADEDEEYLTLAGFMLSHLGRVPVAAEVLLHHGHRFEVMDMDGNRIDKVLVEPQPSDEASPPREGEPPPDGGPTGP